jgi:hypothetical protein
VRPRVARTTGAALLLAAAIGSPTARAQAPTTTVAARTGAAPSFASLPEGHVAPLPETTPPARVASREENGQFVSRGLPPEQAKQMSQARPEMGFSYVFPSQEQARAFTITHGSPDDRIDACLVDGGNAETLQSGRSSEPTEQQPRDWPSSYSAMLSFQFEKYPSPASATRVVVRSKRRARSVTGGEVRAVRSERFVDGQDGHASLEIADAWFDVRTRGVRVFERSTLALQRVLVGPNGVEVYAARDGDALQLVVHVPEHPATDADVADQVRSRLRNMSFTLPDRNGGGSDCGHVRIALRARIGAGQMATLQSVAFLPALDGPAGVHPEGESEDGRRATLFAALRQRPYQLSMSATRTSADDQPVVSLALGWLGRERPVGFDG